MLAIVEMATVVHINLEFLNTDIFPIKQSPYHKKHPCRVEYIN